MTGRAWAGGAWPASAPTAKAADRDHLSPPHLDAPGRAADASGSGERRHSLRAHVLEEDPTVLVAEGPRTIARNYSPAFRQAALALELIGLRKAAVLLDFQLEEVSTFEVFGQAPVICFGFRGEAAKTLEEAGRSLPAQGPAAPGPERLPGPPRRRLRAGATRRAAARFRRWPTQDPTAADLRPARLIPSQPRQDVKTSRKGFALM
jgi:hypothetical protein